MPARSSAHPPPVSAHGIAGPDVRFGVATWFRDVLVRFGYDLFENDHPWEGEWIDDRFEAAALDLRATGSKLLRAMARLNDDPEAGPLTVDLTVGYLRRILDDLAVVIPNCFGTDGRTMPRGDLCGLGFPPPVSLEIRSQHPELYLVIDAAGPTPSLPRATARLREESRAITRAAISSIDAAVAALCPWFDDVLCTLQREVASRADDGDVLLARWDDPDWSVIAPTTSALVERLPRCAR